MPPDAAELALLFHRAQAAAKLAYAPYSRFRVGAALLFDDGAIVTGCNVENASYGLSSCAERNALFRAISERGAAPRIAGIAVANANHAPSPPCGACRQVLSEFVTDYAQAVFPGETGLALAAVSFQSLLPHSFHFEPPRR